MTLHETACREIAMTLRDVSMITPASVVNRLLRERLPEHPYTYATWRRAVRTVQAERARWCKWEGAGPGTIEAVEPLHHRPRRRKKAA